MYIKSKTFNWYPLTRVRISRTLGSKDRRMIRLQLVNLRQQPQRPRSTHPRLAVKFLLLRAPAIRLQQRSSRLEPSHTSSLRRMSEVRQMVRSFVGWPSKLVACRIWCRPCASSSDTTTDGDGPSQPLPSLPSPL